MLTRSAAGAANPPNASSLSTTGLPLVNVSAAPPASSTSAAPCSTDIHLKEVTAGSATASPAMYR